MIDRPPSDPSEAPQPRRATLGAKLILFCTLLTATAVCLAFVALSLSLRWHTKRLLAGTLAHHQRTILSLQQRDLEELLRISSMLTDSPTLRAAMETFAAESDPGSAGRPDLLATIQLEVDKVAADLGRDLLAVTDREGRVLASGGRGTGPPVGADLSPHSLVRHALEQDEPVGAGNLALLRLDDGPIRAGAVPIVLQGFVIGTLVVGDRIDDAFAARLGESFDCDFVVLAGDRPVGSTLGRALLAPDLDALSTRPAPGADAPGVVRLGEQEYVTTRLSLGADAGGQPVDLVLLHSLDRALGDANRRLLWILLVCGASAVALSALAGWRMSRSVVRPLEAFVSFMGQVATSGDHGRRFEGAIPCAEVETLDRTYRQLMESLLEHERRRLESARQELDRLERLKESEKLAALGRMLSGAAHEINNPLTGVVGNLELLLRHPGLDAETRERLERASREGQRISALVRSLLKISRRDTGRRAPVDVHAVLRETADMRRHDFSAANVRLELVLDPERAFVEGNALELQQLFLNLINNAYDALADTGRRDPILTVRSSSADGRITIELEDNGPGMDNPRRVFEPFYTTKAVGKGTGLGLSICHAVVEEHGGEISARNRPQGGAGFCIVLPCCEARASEEVPARPDAGTQEGPRPLAASVLVVDDEPTIVELQREILESLGAAVVGVASGTEAIGALRQRTFDLIVTDLKMPGAVSGQDLFRWAEANLPGATRRFVFVTGEMDGQAGLEFVARVGARCVLKPFAIEDYVAALRETFHGLPTRG